MVQKLKKTTVQNYDFNVTEISFSANDKLQETLRQKLNYRLFNVLIPYRAQGLKAMIEEKPIKKIQQTLRMSRLLFFKLNKIIK